VTLDTVDIEFEQLTIGVPSIFRMEERTGEFEIVRTVVRTTDPGAEVSIDEYLTACYGTTEYSEDLTGMRLSVRGPSGTESIDYAYWCREAAVDGSRMVEAVVPQVDTKLSMRTDARNAVGYFREGFALSALLLRRERE
jgi:hypothetical protein